MTLLSRRFSALTLVLGLLLLSGCMESRMSVTSEQFTITVPATNPRPAYLGTFTLNAESATVAVRLEGAAQPPISLAPARVFSPMALQRLHAFLTAEGLREDPNQQGTLRLALTLSTPELWASHNTSALTWQLRGGAGGTVWISATDHMKPDARPLGGGMGSLPSSYGFGSVAGIADTALRPTAFSRLGYSSKDEIYRAWLDDRERLFLALYGPPLDQAVTGTIASLRLAWHGASTQVVIPFVCASADPRWSDAMNLVADFRKRHAATPDLERRTHPDLQHLEVAFSDLAANPPPGDQQAKDRAAATWNLAIIAALRADYVTAKRLGDEAQRGDPKPPIYRSMPRLMGTLGTARGHTASVNHTTP